jgi:VCBS repeat-containing protein
MPPRFPSIALGTNPISPTAKPGQGIARPEWGTITGKIADQLDLMAALQAFADKAETQSQIDAINVAIEALGGAVGGLNSLPTLSPLESFGQDTALTLVGNVLAGVVDPEGDALTVSAFSYKGTARTLGTTFAVDYGTFRMSADGTWVYTLSSAARAMTAGDLASELILYQVRDARGDSTGFSPLTISIGGTNQAPLASSDVLGIPLDQPSSGNVLQNDVDYEAATLTVTGFVVFGDTVAYGAGQTATTTAGQIAIASNGAWTFTPNTGFVGLVPRITYTVTDGTSMSNAVLTLAVTGAGASSSDLIDWFNSYRGIAPDPSRIAANPALGRAPPNTSFVVGTYPDWDWTCSLPTRIAVDATSLDFEVGPGKAYTTLDSVPWETLLPGDRVFIYWRPAPYKEFISMTVRGDELRWIEVIGVPGPNGEMPVIDGDHAIANPAHSYAPDREGSGMVICAPKPYQTFGWKPGYLHFHGLKFVNVKHGHNFTARDGVVYQWGYFVSPFIIHGCDHVTITGCEINTCGIGVFVNSTQNERLQSRDIHLAFNYITNCGNVSSASEHNVYVEAVGSIYEFNYFGAPIVGTWGNNIKERSAGFIYRYNYMITGGAYALAIQDPDSNAGWEGAQIDSLGESLMSKAFIYGNTFVTEPEISDGFVTALIEYGAGGDYSSSNPQYRYGAIHFYNNVVVSRVNANVVYMIPSAGATGAPTSASNALFVIANSRLPTTVHARNNLFYGTFRDVGHETMPFALFSLQGWASWQQNYITTFQNSQFPYLAGTYNRGVPFDGSGLGGLVARTDDPGFRGFALGDYALDAGSPFYTFNAPLHADAVARGLICSNFGPTTPFGVVNPPVNTTPPAVNPHTGTTVAAQTTLTATAGVWAWGVDTRTYAWRLDGVTVGSSSSYTPQVGDIGKTLTLVESVVNTAGTAQASSTSYAIVSVDQPVNTALPTISGAAMDSSPVSVANGTWTNSPVSYAYTYKLDGVTVAVGIYTPNSFDIGKTLTVVVTATTAGASTGTATTAGKVVTAIQYNPDGSGNWLFTAADNTALTDLSPKWAGNHSLYKVVGNALVGTSFFIGGCYLNDTTHGVSQSVGCVLNPGGGANVQMVLQTNDGTAGGYFFELTYDGFVNIFLGSTLVQGLGFMASTSNRTTAQTTMKATLVNSGSSAVLTCWLNGDQIYQHTFTGSDVLTGGHPGLRIIGANGWPIDSWTDNPQ